MKVIIVILYFFLGSMFIFHFLKKQLLFNPVLIYIIYQCIMFIGIFPYLDMNIQADRVHLWILFASLCCVIMGALIVDFSMQGRHIYLTKKWISSDFELIENSTHFNIFLFIIIVISIIISQLYFSKIGYNLFLESLKSFIRYGATLDDIATLRLSTYNAYVSGVYLYPGFINQFKNILLPILSYFILARSILLKKKAHLIVAILVMLIANIYLLGTGQRGAFVNSLIIGIIFLFYSLPRKKVIKFMIPFIFFGLLLFLMQTLFLGRDVAEINNINDIYKLINSFFSRVFDSNQYCSVFGFRFIYNLPIQYGLEWLQDFKVLLPGPGPVGINNILFYQMYGSYRGTAMISNLDSIWLNFGWIGIILISILIGIIYQALYIHFIKLQKTLAQLLIYSSAFFIIGTWVSGDPTSIINQGLITVIILGIIFKLIQRNDRKRLYYYIQRHNK